MMLVEIDPYNYGRDVARRQMRGIWFYVLYCTGAANLYLDYQIWRMHFRLWHPISWIVAFVFILVYGLSGIKELKSEMRVPKDRREYSYRKAPRTAKGAES